MVISPGCSVAEPGVHEYKRSSPGRGARKLNKLLKLLTPLPGLDLLLYAYPGFRCAAPGANHRPPYRGGVVFASTRSSHTHLSLQQTVYPRRPALGLLERHQPGVTNKTLQPEVIAQALQSGTPWDTPFDTSLNCRGMQ